MIGSVECVLKQPFTYDALGRMTSRQAVTAVNGVPQVTTVFSQPVFNNTKVHALSSATATAEPFPSNDQTITYTGFDKVSKVKQGNDSLCYAYGYDRQRILMEEHVGGTSRTKQYWGACEYVTETEGNTTSSCWRTFVTGPYGVFAVVEANYTSDDTFDGPMFDRGFTGHEHLTDFGLINMNGRMYDPVMSSFLSADRFVQNPLTAQGFNRYSYCMNNPLRFIDPTGWLPGDGGSGGSLPHIIIGGQTNYILPEITIRPDDNPSLSNPHEKPNYPMHYYGSSPTDLPAWGDPSNRTSIGWNNGTGCGGGSGTHGGEKQNIDVAAVVLTTMWGASLAEPSPGGEIVSGVVTLAATIYYGQELIDKMKVEIAHLETRFDGPVGFVYELRAQTDGIYPCVNKTASVVYLETGEIWKIGETTQGTNRYLDKWYQTNNVRMVPVFYGNQREIKIQEKIMIYNNYIQHGHLPPGNKIFR